MANIYIDPKGLAGNWNRASGKEYERLKKEVLKAVRALKDPETGASPLAKISNADEAVIRYELPKERVGDLIVETNPPYLWFEELSTDLEVFTDPPTSGFKQTVDSKKHNCVWTPFVVWGPGVKRGQKLSAPIRHQDQLPTLLKLMGEKVPAHFQGRVLSEIIEE